jgi:CubicO group peptidase (beta-lactamase class C family)
MSRSLRGRGPRAPYPSGLARLLLSRDRPAVRIRASLAAGGLALAALAAAAWPERQLHTPVLQAIGVEITTGLAEESVSTMSEYLEPPFESVEAIVGGLDPRRLDAAVAAVRQEVRRGGVPGAALVLGRGGRVVEKRGFGQLGPGLGEVEPDGTLYDLASLTKVLATTTAVMLLVEDGRMELDAPVERYLPDFTGGQKSRVTIRHLLTHTSGLPAGVGLPAGPPSTAMGRLVSTPLNFRPGERVVYSDVGPVILYAAAERVAGEPLEALLRRRVFEPLGMRSTGFRPESCERCAPTAATIRGRVHDPIAQRLGGVAGNAGLFSTAADVGRFAAMLAGGGELGGVRVLREETIRTFAARQAGAGTRALGWDTPTARGAGAGGSTLSRRSFGHTGFTGTSLWIDPDRGTWAVLLTNRTFAAGVPNRIQAVRRTVNDRLAEAADLGTPAD